MTALGEAALGQLTKRAADYRVLLRLWEGAANNRRGRHLRDAMSMRHGNALTDVVAVVESFAVARLLNLRPTVAPDQVMRWADRIKMWKTHGGVDLTGYPSWRPFMGFVEVRNALAHGLGRLTDRQLGKYRGDVLPQIAATGVRLDGDLVLVCPDDVRRCGEIGEEFVRFLDLEAPKA